MGRDNFIDVTGQTFGKWFVIERTAQKKRVRWLCRCECGTVKEVGTNDLRSGKSRSCQPCGALRPNAIKNTHQLEYQSWAGAKQRCFYPKHNEYHRYGGRGITMCQEWVENFTAFLSYVGQRPTPLHSLDRWPNKDGNYEPGNVRWATREEQGQNTSKNVIVTYLGETMTLKQLANRLHLGYFRLHGYYRRRGYTLEQSIANVQSRPPLRRSSAANAPLPAVLNLGLFD